MKRASVCLSDPIYDALRLEANKHRQSVSSLVRQWAQEYFFSGKRKGPHQRLGQEKKNQHRFSESP